jgi:carboxylesterase type B
MKLFIWTILVVGISARLTDVPIVDTTSGRVVGTHARWRPNVWLYSGIPFAKPPIDDLRWRKPIRFPRSKSIIQATTPPQ